MRYSKLVGKTNKTAKTFDSVNATLLQKGGYVELLMSGVYTYLPLGLKVLRKIEAVVRTEMEAIGGEEVLMPALHPRENWDATGRWDKVDVLFKLKGAGDSDLALGPTHEEVVTPLMKQQIFSYQDLPRSVFQVQTKFRNEARSKSGLLRGREFLMKDMYSFHTDDADLNTFYSQVEQAYSRVWQKLGIDAITLKTFASGGAFSKFSHEYQTLSPVGEDLIYVCQKCQIAINKEILAEQSTCPQCSTTELTEKTAIEVGNIFKLGTRFSDAFEFQYVEKDQNRKAVHMGCYGIGISRLMGVLVEVFNDGKAIFWPENIAPFEIHLIGLNLEDEIVRANAEKMYADLKAMGKDVLFDDRVGVSAGEKFADADLVGVPNRYIISKRTGATPEIKKIERPALV